MAATLSGHTVGVNSVAFTADSKTLAVAGLDNVVTVWDVAAAKQRLPPGRSHEHGSVGGLLSRRQDAGLGGQGYAILWDLPTGKARAKLNGHTEGVEFVAFTGRQDRRHRRLGRRDQAVGRRRGQGAENAGGSGRSIFCVAYSPDGKTLAVSGPGANGKVQLWDTATLSEPAILKPTCAASTASLSRRTASASPYPLKKAS